MRSKWIVLVAVCLVTVLSMWGLKKTVYVKENLRDVQALWNKNELFIFITRTKSVVRISRLGLMAKSLLGSPFLSHEALGEDLFVFHLDDKRISRHEVPNFSSQGRVYPFNEKVYLGRGGEESEWPLIWQWTGSDFLRIDKPLAMTITNAQAYTDASVKNQGWSRYEYLPFQPGERSYPISVGGRNVSLVLAWDRRGEKYSVIIRGIPEQMGSGHLIDADRSYRAVTDRIDR